MFETNQFSLPLLQASQAQKHITVNEALCRLDAVAQLRVQQVGVTVPPISGIDGQAYVVGDLATGDWTGQDGNIALWFNGGWEFISPLLGWRAFDVSAVAERYYNGQDWVLGAVVCSGSGAATVSRIVEFDHVLGAEAVSVTATAIPSHSSVLGVTARVVVPIAGTGVSTWGLGVNGDPTRYGNGLGMALNSYALGLGATPTTYWSETALEISADAGSFTGGTIRLAVHLQELSPPIGV